MWTKAQMCASLFGEVRHLKLAQGGIGRLDKSEWLMLRNLRFSHRPGVGTVSLKSFKADHGLTGESIGGSDGKESPCNVGDLGSIPGSERFSWRREWQPTSVLLPGEFHRQRSLAGFSPWVAKTRLSK